MSEAQSDRLVRQENVDPRQARRALESTEGDYERARTLLQEAPVAVKFRFASQDEEVYGLGLIILNVSPPGLETLRAMVGNDRSIATVSISQGYRDLETEIERQKSEVSTMSALGERLTSSLREEFSPPSDRWLPLLRSRNEMGLQDQLEEFVAGVMDEEGLILTADLEAGLLDHSEPDEESGETESTSPSSPGKREDRVTLLCDVNVSPVKGRSVQQLEPGDSIFVDVHEDQDQHRALLQVMDRLRNDETGLIPAQVANTSKTATGKVEILVQFGENVYGRTVAGEDMNILTPDVVETASPVSEETLTSPFVWVLVAVVLITIAILLWYATLFL